METQPLTFHEIRHAAYVHGQTILDLAAMLAIHHPTYPDGPGGEYDAAQCKAMGEQLMGIRGVLDLIAYNRDASLNREALDALETIVRHAEFLVAEEWVKDIFKSFDKVMGQPKGYEVVPF